MHTGTISTDPNFLTPISQKLERGIDLAWEIGNFGWEHHAVAMRKDCHEMIMLARAGITCHMTAESCQEIVSVKSVLAEAWWKSYHPPMKSLLLEIPEEVLASAKIPRAQLETELRRRLAGTLYADGVIGGAAACKLAGLEKAEFQYWLGERRIAQPLDGSDYQLERQNLEEWLKNV